MLWAFPGTWIAVSRLANTLSTSMGHVVYCREGCTWFRYVLGVFEPNYERLSVNPLKLYRVR